MQKLILSAFLVLILAVTNLKAQDKNIFLDRAYWQETPSLNDVKDKIKAGNDPVAFNSFKFNGIMYALLAEVPSETIIYLMENYSKNIHELTHDGRNYLHWAAMGGKMEVIKYLIDHKVKVDLVDDHGYTVITFAAITAQTNPEVYDYLIAHGANITDTNHEGANSLLLLTPHLKDDAMINYFVSKGLSLKDKDNDGNGVFYYTAKTGNKEMMDLLIKKGVDYKSKNKIGGNAMIAASQGTRRGTNDLSVFQYLEAKGIKPNVVTKEGTTPLHAVAAKAKDIEVVKYFLDKGVKADQQDAEGNTALINAAARNTLDIVKLIESKSKDINLQNKAGETALFAAVKGNSTEVVDFLISEGAKTNLTDKAENSIGHYLISSYRTGGRGGADNSDFDTKATLLKKNGLDPKQKQANGNTLLHLAVEKNSLPLVKKVVAMGVNINEANNEGTTPLQIAAMKATDTSVLKYLVEQGADKKVKTDFDESVFDLASENEVLSENQTDIQFLK